MTTKMKTSRNMEYVKTNFLSENDKLIGLSLGISKINSQVAELVDAGYPKGSLQIEVMLNTTVGWWLGYTNVTKLVQVRFLS